MSNETVNEIMNGTVAVESFSTAKANVFKAVALAYMAVALHNLVIRSMGGLKSVPMILFGLCQLTPALVVLALKPAYLGRLWQLLSKRVSIRTLAWSYALTVAALGLCIILPYELGFTDTRYSLDVMRSYPLRALVPAAWLQTGTYWIYVLLGAPILHLLTATGEEVLWRGYLLDEMLQGFEKKTVYWLNGIFWGFWHLPMIVLLNWDFPGHPVLGVLTIVASQIAWSKVMIDVRLKTDSLWPVIVMHTVANAMTIGLYDRMINHEYNLIFSPWGFLGGAVMGSVILFKSIFRNKER